MKKVDVLDQKIIRDLDQAIDTEMKGESEMQLTTQRRKFPDRQRSARMDVPGHFKDSVASDDESDEDTLDDTPPADGKTITCDKGSKDDDFASTSHCSEASRILYKKKPHLEKNECQTNAPNAQGHRDLRDDTMSCSLIRLCERTLSTSTVSSPNLKISR